MSGAPNIFLKGHNNWRVGLPYTPADPEEVSAVEYLYEDDGGSTKSTFSDSVALGVLLLHEVAFLNSNWREKTWPKEAQGSISVNICINDVFAWGVSDAETIGLREIEGVYRFWAKDPAWGTTIWAMIRRKEMPQRPIEKRIRDAGVWDLDQLQVEHDLRANHYDGVGGVLAKRKYDSYCAWECARGQTPRVFDGGWWTGWREYTTAHPDWHSDNWKAEDDRLVREWKAANGHPAPPMTSPSKTKAPA